MGAHNPTFTACVFARISSPLSASDLEEDDQFATTVEDNAGTLANYSVDIEKFEGFELPSFLFFFCEVEHPSEAVVVSKFLFFFLALVATWLHFPCCTFPRECVVQLLTGGAFDTDDCAVPFKSKDTPSPSSEFPIQAYPSISRRMDAQDVVRDTVQKMYLRSLDLST